MNAVIKRSVADGSFALFMENGTAVALPRYPPRDNVYMCTNVAIPAQDCHSYVETHEAVRIWAMSAFVDAEGEVILTANSVYDVDHALTIHHYRTPII